MLPVENAHILAMTAVIAVNTLIQITIINIQKINYLEYN
jgi:hypothetical protein